jgi:spore coat protein U-like protein
MIAGAKGLRLAGVVCALWLPTQGWAASCTISATAAGFGIYDETQNDAAVATISGSCSRGRAGDPDVTSTIVSLSAGASGTYVSRQMVNGANRLNYNLYTTAARSVVWGDGSGVTVTRNALTVQGNGRFLNPNSTRTFSLPAYGRIPAGQSVPRGPYADTITVTITY